MKSLEPIKTEKSNFVFKAPEGMENCKDLHVEKTDEQIISTWSFDYGDIELRIFGQAMPPVSLGFKENNRLTAALIDLKLLRDILSAEADIEFMDEEDQNIISSIEKRMFNHYLP